MCFVAALPVAASLIGGVMQNRQQRKAADAARRADEEARNAAKTAPGTQEAKTPNRDTALAAAGAPTGGSGLTTLLTGPGGVDPDELSLGRNNVMGGNTLLGA
jgi:hypothetical protein